MQGEENKKGRERRDWIILLIILFIGFLCMFLAGERAIRFAPRWRLSTNMRSNIDPNSDFLTSRPGILLEPLDPAVLTQSGWMDIFLTPGATFQPSTPIPPSLTATLPLPTQTQQPTNTPVVTTTPTSTFPVIINPTNPPVYKTPTFTSVPGPTATYTDTPVSNADLQITKTDNQTDYVAGALISYTITVSNAGPSNVAGATVMDIFSTNPDFDYSTVSWSCTPASGASCQFAAGTGDINQTVNIPSGTFVTFTIAAQAVAGPLGDLVNTATVNAPAGVTDLNPANNSWTDTDFLIVPDPLPPEIGTTPGGSWYQLMQGSTLTLNIPVVADGDVGIYDFVYYEILNSNPPPLILMDCIIVRVGDGENWYTVFNWGDNSPDANTNANYQNLTLPVTPPNPEEMDERTVSANDLYNTTGIAIDIDAIVPPGIYPYIQFYAPPDGNDGQAEIDAIEILP